VVFYGLEGELTTYIMGGFDDIAVARWCAPPLTTIRQPFAEMGETAARILLSLASGEPPTRSRVELGTTLIVRDSTAPPAATES